MKADTRKKIAILLSIAMIVSTVFTSMAASLRYESPVLNKADTVVTDGTWVKDNQGSWKVRSQEGILKNGWYYLCDETASGKNNWYYFDENGNMKTGWIADLKNPGNWYYASETKDGSYGGLVTGWVTDPQDGKKYYLDPDTGIMCHGWKQIGGNWYYFSEKQYADVTWTKDANGNWIAGTGKHSYGTMYCNEMTPDGYYVGANGVWKKTSSSGSSNGHMQPILTDATTSTAQRVGCPFNKDGLTITIYKRSGESFQVKLPDDEDTVSIYKTTVNGIEDGLLKAGKNNIEIRFVYHTGDVIIGQTMKTSLTVSADTIDYSSLTNWYQTGGEYGSNKIDVFYILWTMIMKAEDDEGNPAFNSTLSAQDRKIMDGGFKHSVDIIFDTGNFNLYAPYYRQMTMSSFLYPEKIESAMITATMDICKAFEYYLNNWNNGRPFIIAGFSQGGLMTKVLLKYMNEKNMGDVYSRMIAAYSMGFQVTQDDLGCDYIKLATGSDDLGVIISYNSVDSADAIWEQVAGESVGCINPLNWETDGTSETLNYDGDTATVSVAKLNKKGKDTYVLLVEGLNNDKYDGKSYDGTVDYGLPRGNYHMWEMKFYADAIKVNAINRAEKYDELHPNWRDNN